MRRGFSIARGLPRRDGLRDLGLPIGFPKFASARSKSERRQMERGTIVAAPVRPSSLAIASRGGYLPLAVPGPLGPSGLR